MLALALALSTLSLAVLAAHFLRRGELVPAVAALAVLGALLFVRRRWVVRLAQGVLLLAVVVWSLTTFQLVQQRRAAGQPVARLAVILGAVVAVNALAALALGTRRVAGRYGGPAGQGPAAN